MTEETAVPEAREPGRDPRTQDPRLWRDDGWTARVIKNIDDDGWAVEMIKDGEPEPALTGPWTMGRDKKNPKPLDATAFATLVKTASEVLARHEQHQHARRARRALRCPQQAGQQERQRQQREPYRRIAQGKRGDQFLVVQQADGLRRPWAAEQPV